MFPMDTKPVTRGNDVVLTSKPWELTIYMEKPEIPVGKSNGSHYSVWNVLQVMGYRLWYLTYRLPFNLVSADG